MGALSAAVGIAVMMRVYFMHGLGLWYDELQSVTHAVQSPLKLLRTVHSADPHPPLYYLQLHVWMLFGQSDFWLKLNSLFWSLATLPVIYFVGRKHFSGRVAVLAVFLFAISPLAVLQSGDLRMYPFVGFFAALSIYALLNLTQSDAVRHRDKLILFGSLIVITFSHGTGFLALVPPLSYGILLLMRRRGDLAGAKWAIAVGLVALLIAVPWLYLAHDTSLNHLSGISVEALARMIHQFVLGARGSETAGVIVLVLVTLLGFLSLRYDLEMTVAFLFVPVVALLLLSAFVTPLLHVRAISFMLPVFVLLAARTLAFELRPEIWAGITVLLLCGSVLALSKAHENTERYAEYRDVSQFLLDEAPPAAVIDVPQGRIFWGFAWYLQDRPGDFQLWQRPEMLAISDGRIVRPIRDVTISTEPGRNWSVQLSKERDPDTGNLIAEIGRFSIFEHIE